MPSPFPSGALVDASGQVAPAWRMFFLQLYERTGSSSASGPPSLDAVTGLIQGEATARSGAQATITGRLDAEIAVRASADNVLGAAITNEIAARTNSITLEVSRLLPRPGDLTWTTGTGAPTATEPLGSLYSRAAGTVGATLYVSRGGGTWAAVAGV